MNKLMLHAESAAVENIKFQAPQRNTMTKQNLHKIPNSAQALPKLSQQIQMQQL